MPPVAAERAAGPWLRGFTGAAVEPSDGFSSYNPQMSQLYPPDMLVPTTALTLADGSKYDVDYLLNKVYHFVASIDSWEFTVLPIQFMAGMVTKWQEEITHFTLLQVTAEGVTPQLIEYQTAVHSLRKDHFQQGFEMKGEYFAHPGGQHEFQVKREALANNVVGSMQFAIKTAVVGSLDHWYDYQRKFGREFHNYHEAAQEAIGSFGALNWDEKAIYKDQKMMMDWTQGDVRAPDIDTLVVAKGLLSTVALGGAATFETEGDRVGVNNANQMLRSRGRAMSGRLPVKNVFEDRVVTPTNKPSTDVNLFTMNTITSAFAVLEGKNKGPEDKLGRRYPTIQLITIPGDDYHTFTQREALENDLRFDKVTGELDTRAYDNFLRQLPSLMRDGRFDFSNGPPPDMFLWRTRETHVNGIDYGDSSEYARAEFYGDLEIHKDNVPEDWDCGVGREAALAATERGDVTKEDLLLINKLLDACRSVYHLNNKIGSDVMGEILRASTGEVEARGLTDTEWGGYDFEFVRKLLPADNADALAQYPKPYGFGSAALMMSFYKTTTQEERKQRFPNWHYNDIDYSATKRALNNLWAFNQRVFPENALASPRYVPIGMYNNFGKGTDANSRRARAALFGSLLEGLHYGTFVSAVDRNIMPPRRDYTSLFPENMITRLPELRDYVTEEFDRANASYERFSAAFAQWVTNGTWTFATTQAADWPEFVEWVVSSRLSRPQMVNVLAATIPYVLGMMGYEDEEGPDPRAVQPFSEKLIVETFAGLDATKRGSPVTGEGSQVQAEGVLELHPSMLTFSGKSWTAGYVNIPGISPADAKDPSKPVIGTDHFMADNQADGIATAVLPMARSRLSKTAFAHARAPHGVGEMGEMPGVYPRNIQTRADAAADISAIRSSPTFATEPAPHFVGATAGFAVGGPFAAIVPPVDGASAPTIAERRNMISRFDYVKKNCRDWFERLCAFSYLASRINIKSLMAMLNNGVTIPCNNMLVNPFIQLQTNMLMFLKSGESTGFLGHNYAQSAFGKDPGHLEYKFNLVGWMVAVVTTPSNIITLPTAALAGFRGGLAATFVTDPEEYWRMCKKRTDMPLGPSMFSFSVPPGFTREHARQMGGPASLQGRLNADYVRYKVDSAWLDKQNERPSFPGYMFYDSIIDFKRVNRDRKFLEGSQVARRKNTHVPLDLYLRRSRIFNAVSGRYENNDSGTGPIDNVGNPPILGVLAGGMTFDNTRKAKT